MEKTVQKTTQKAVKKTAEQVGRGARKATHEARPWVIGLARLGYASKGIVYVLTGWLAFQASRGAGSARVNTRIALMNIITQPFGRFLLALLGFGLLGYALWRVVQAIVDPENAGSDLKGILKRAGYVITGISGGVLAAFAFQLILGRGGSDGEQAPKDWTARLLAQPYGPWLVGLAGLVVVGIGVAKLYSAYAAQFEQHFDMHEMSAEARQWVVLLGRFGYVARGIVYGVIGLILFQAARQYNPQRAGGVGEALVTLASQPYGVWILAVVALGLTAYGLYVLALARYRRIYL